MAAKRNITSIEAMNVPAEHADVVAPSDTADLINVSRGLYVGGAGNVKVTMYGGETVTLQGILAGTVLPIQVCRVWSTGTTASLMIALW